MSDISSQSKLKLRRKLRNKVKKIYANCNQIIQTPSGHDFLCLNLMSLRKLYSTLTGPSYLRLKTVSFAVSLSYYVWHLYSPSTTSFLSTPLLWPSCLARANDNGPILVQSTPFPPVEETFCPPAIQESSIENYSKSIYHIKYYACCWDTQFRCTHRDGEYI